MVVPRGGKMSQELGVFVGTVQEHKYKRQICGSLSQICAGKVGACRYTVNTCKAPLRVAVRPSKSWRLSFKTCCVFSVKRARVDDNASP